MPRNDRKISVDRNLKYEVKKFYELTEESRKAQEERKKLEELRAKEQPPTPAKPQIEQAVFTITFYTSLPDEGGGLGLTASGKNVSYGMVANNHLPFGTKIQLEGLGVFTVEDRGSKTHFKDPNKLDVFIPRQKGESDSQYKSRVLAMGVKKIQGAVLN